MLKDIVHAFLFLSILLMFGCSSKYKVKEVDNDLQVYGEHDGEKIGLDKNRDVIIQREITAEAELKVQQLNNYDTQQKIDRAIAELTQCRAEIADPRLGGNGKVTELPEVDNMKAIPEIREEIGLTKSDELKVVKREYYTDRLKLERSYGSTMNEMLRTLNKFNRTCSQELGVARVKVGLPAERYEGRGHFDSNHNWVVERQAEKNLDDAFKIRGPAMQESNGE